MNLKNKEAFDGTDLGSLNMREEAELNEPLQTMESFSTLEQ